MEVTLRDIMRYCKTLEQRNNLLARHALLAGKNDDCDRFLEAEITARLIRNYIEKKGIVQDP